MCAFGASRMSLGREDTRKKISARGEVEKESNGMGNAQVAGSNPLLWGRSGMQRVKQCFIS